MPAKKKKQDEIVDVDDKTPLQKFLLSSQFDALIISVIGLNCAWMAMDIPGRPENETPTFLTVGAYAFSVFFVIECILKQTQFGFVYYFMNPWNWLDYLIVIISLVEFAFALLQAFASILNFKGLGNLKVLRVLRVARFLRILRPLRTVKFIPALLTYVEALIKSGEDFWVNVMVLIVMTVMFSFVSTSLIGDKLQFRCVPTNFTNVNVTNNTYYIHYDKYFAEEGSVNVSYFTSIYNSNYCSYSSYTGGTQHGKHCVDGFTCLKVHSLKYAGVNADFETPFDGFLTSLAFLTMRGWPNIFWAIADSTSETSAWAYLCLVVGFGAIFIVNMFPAIFIYSLKTGDEREKKLSYLELFPGDKKSVSEFELLAWANANEAYILTAGEKKNTDGVLTVLFNAVMSVVNLARSLAPIKNSGKEAEYIDPELADEEWIPKKKIYCIPRCSRCPKLREMMMDDQSAVNMFIIAIILINIGVMGANSTRTDPLGQKICEILNMVFTAIFGLEVVVKVGVMGPCLYFDNGFNILDFSLVALSLPSFFAKQFHFVNSFRAMRMLRLARLIRLARLVRVVKSVYNSDTGEVKEYILPGKIFAILVDLGTPASNVLLLLTMTCYVFSMLGMQLLFPYRKPVIPDDPIINRYSDPLNFLTFRDAGAHVDDLRLNWGGRYTNQMNFNCFGNAFVTVVNIAFLNNWYNIMVDTINRGTKANLIFFFSFLILCQFIPLGSLLASVTSLMESNAVTLLREKAERNKRAVDRVGDIALLAQVRACFKLIKKNTIEVKTGGSANVAKPVKRPEVLDVYTPPTGGNFFEEFIEARKKYPMYLFSPKGYYKQLAQFISSNILFQVIVTVSTIVAVGQSLSSTPPSFVTAGQWAMLNFVITAVFLLEMLIKWINQGFWLEDGYFKDLLNWIDFAVNAAMMLALFIDLPGVKIFRIARLVKIPNAMKFAVKSRPLKGLIVAFDQSGISVMSNIVVVSVLALFFSIVGINLFGSHYGHCSDSTFPAGTHKDNKYKSPRFPYGCNDRNADGIPIHWIQTTLDSYEDIFTAVKASFRVMTNNEWHGLMYDTMNTIGSPGYQPIEFRNRSVFLFFFFLMILAATFAVLAVALIYYHYIIVITMAGRKNLFGESSAFWVVYEDKLSLVTPTFSENKLLVKLQNNITLKLAACVFVFVPIIIHLHQNESPLGLKNLFDIDLIFNVVYVALYSWRLSGKGVASLWKGGLFDKQECVIAVLLSASAANSLTISLTGSKLFPADRVVLAQCGTILRVQMLVIFFPQMQSFFKLLYVCIPAYVPQFMYVIMSVFIFAILGNSFLGKVKPGYNEPFLDEHYNFGTLAKACVMLISMGTGNVWTEIIAGYKHGHGWVYSLAIEIFFNLFYLLFSNAIKTFPLIMIYSYLTSSGGLLGLAIQQVRQFRLSWERHGNPRRISYQEFFEMLKELPPPLGRFGLNVCYLDTTRFAKRVLLCMPVDMGLLDQDEFDKPKDVMAFSMETLPDDIRVFDKPGKSWGELLEQVIPDSEHKSGVISLLKAGFTFKQVITATHRNFVDGPRLPDEDDLEGRRGVHQKRLRLVRLRLGRLIVSKKASTNPRSTNSMSIRGALLMQRLDPLQYREYFRDIVSRTFYSLLRRISTFGFSLFDSFVLTKLRLALKTGLLSATQQVTIREQYIAPGCPPSARINLEKARLHLTVVRRLSATAKSMYEQYVNKKWKLSSLEEGATLAGVGGVAAIVVDSRANIVGAFMNGVIKIWSKSDGVGDVTERSKFRLQQKLKLKGRIRSMAASGDAKQIGVGIGNDVIVLAEPGGRRRAKRTNFKEFVVYRGHTASVNAVLHFDRFFISGGDDGHICMWSGKSEDPLKTFNAGAAVISLTTIPIKEKNVADDERTLTTVVAAGTRDGRVVILPLPLNGAPLDASPNWVGVPFRSMGSPVTALQVVWGFLYGGHANGTVKAWFVNLVKDSTTIADPVRMVRLVEMSSQPVHSGPVTAIQTGGGFLFTASHDFSILPWTPPDNLAADNAVEFDQDYLSGLILHGSAVVAMVANKYMIVSGDEEGKILVTRPGVSEEDLTGSDDAKVAEAKTMAFFSFHEYDFGSCFISHQGITMEEQTILTITNTTGLPITIRRIGRNNNNFRLEQENDGVGGRTISSLDGSSTGKSAYELQPLCKLKYRVIFTPEGEGWFKFSFNFLINELATVSVNVKGYGTKPKLFIENGRKQFDFGTVFVGTQPKALSFTVVNASTKDIAVNCLDYPTDINEAHQLKEAEEDKRLAREAAIAAGLEYEEEEEEEGTLSLSSRIVEIVPRCFLVKARGKTKVVLRFNPQKPYATFNIPMRFDYCGGLYTMANILGRSELKRASDGSTLQHALSSESSVMLNQSELLLARGHGLRDLHDNETLCPAELIGKLLSDKGWAIKSDDDDVVTTVFSKSSGFFLEFPAGRDRREIVDKIQITYSCPDEVGETPYEVWHGQRMLASGVYRPPEPLAIIIETDDLFQSAEADAEEVFGTQVLELMLFVPGTIARTKCMAKSSINPDAVDYMVNIYGRLRSVVYFRVHKGFRVSKLEDEGPMEFSNRVSIDGIERIIQCLESSCGNVYQAFGRQPSASDKKDAGSAIFAPATISLRGSEAATHYAVKENVDGVDNATQSDVFISASGMEYVSLKRPRKNGSSVEDPKRRVDISMYREEVDVNSNTMENFDLFKTVIPLHTSTDIVERSIEAKVPPLLLLPFEVVACSDSGSLTGLDKLKGVGFGERIKIEAVLPEEAETLEKDLVKKMHIATDSIQAVAKFDEKFRIDSLHGFWYFILDGKFIKLLSADPDASSPEEIICTEINFLIDGIEAIGETCCWKSKGCEVVFVEEAEELALVDDKFKIDSKVVRISSVVGTAYPPLEPSKVFQDVWKVVARDNFLAGIKRSFFKMAEHRQHEMLTAATIESQSILDQQQKLEEEEVAKRTVKRLTADDFEKRKEAQDRAKAILNAVPQRVTYKEVYDTVTFASSEFNTKKRGKSYNEKKLSVFRLREYMEEIPLPGAMETFSHAQTEVATRGLHRDDKGMVSVEGFRAWYEAAEGDDMMAEMDEYTTFAKMLEDEESYKESWGVDDYDSAAEEEEEEEEEEENMGEMAANAMKRLTMLKLPFGALPGSGGNNFGAGLSDGLKQLSGSLELVRKGSWEELKEGEPEGESVALETEASQDGSKSRRQPTANLLEQRKEGETKTGEKKAGGAAEALPSSADDGGIDEDDYDDEDDDDEGSGTDSEAAPLNVAPLKAAGPAAASKAAPAVVPAAATKAAPAVAPSAATKAASAPTVAPTASTSANAPATAAGKSIGPVGGAAAATAAADSESDEEGDDEYEDDDEESD